MATPDESEIIEGYWDGYLDDRPDLPESMSNRSELYRFGWLNGRDDRRHQPRKSAAALRVELAELLARA